MILRNLPFKLNDFSVFSHVHDITSYVMCMTYYFLRNVYDVLPLT